jgi:hypothetical protein
MAGQERHPPPVDVAHGQRSRWLAVGRGQADLLDIIEELIEPRPPEHPDVCYRHGRKYDLQSEEEDEDELELFESEPLDGVDFAPSDLVLSDLVLDEVSLDLVESFDEDPSLPDVEDEPLFFPVRASFL